MRAAIYIRVSTEEQAIHGYSLASQLEACRKRAKELGATTVLEFSDEGISGSTLDRPGLEKLRQSVQKGLVDIVIILDPDRFSRKLAHQLLLTEEFEKAGVSFSFINFEWKDSPEGRLFYSIKGAVSEYEREKIKERMIRGKNQKARQGGMPMNFSLFGYDYNSETGVRINEKEAEVVRFIFTSFTLNDMSPAAIAIVLTDFGIPTKKGKTFWHRQVVRQILMNSAYYGEWHYGKNREQQIIIPVPAIISKETWQKAQAYLKESKRLWAKRGKQQYLLTGLITCSDCGMPMSGVYASNWGNKYRGYTCRKSQSTNRNRGCNPAKIINADSLELIVWEKVQKLLRNPDEILFEVRKNLPHKNNLEEELERIEKRLQETEKGRESLIEALASGLLDLDEKTKAKLYELKRRKDTLLTRQKEVENNIQVAMYSDHSLAGLYQMTKEVLDKIDDLDFDEKKAIIRSLVSQVIISGRINTTNHKIEELPGVEITVVFKIEDVAGGNSNNIQNNI